MNRTLIVVKDPYPFQGYKWGGIRLHWQYGQEVENFLTNCVGQEWRDAWRLIESGHRSTLLETYDGLGTCSSTSYHSYWTLKQARRDEHITFAWHNGKRWRFSVNLTHLGLHK